MSRPSGEKNRAGGRWTEARYNSFIKSLLRSGTRRWAPISDCLKKARTRRGFYMCSACGEEVPASTKVDGKRVKNAVVDHINPIIDPTKGFESWDVTIERMFCEEDGLAVMCNACHTEKTNKERAVAKERREKEKNNAQ